jgi:dienelactone hydrolase
MSMTQLPHPNGPYSIGTSVRQLVDTDRHDIFHQQGDVPRELMVQLWYPAEPDPSGKRARYIDDTSLLAPLADLMNLPPTAFDGLDSLETHATPDAPVASDEQYPVLVFSHGRCGFRNHNTALVEELASHGYVVATIDHPYAATGVAFPDGRKVMFDRRLLPPWPRDHVPGSDPTVMDQVMPFLGQDVVFVMDELERLNSDDPGGLLSNRLDMSRLASFGVSLGGMLAAAASVADSRIRACLIMDTYLPASVVDAGLSVPTMWITRDAGTMCLEGWSRADIDDTHNTMRNVFERLPLDGYVVLIPGMYHVDFSDGRLLSPLIEERGISGTVPLWRALGIVSDYTLTFFDKHLKSRPARLLEVLQSDDPRVQFERRSDEDMLLAAAARDEEALAARA